MESERHNLNGVKAMSVLGVAMDANGSAMASVEASLALAEKVACTNKHRWGYKDNVGKNLKTWQREIQPAAPHGARTWELSYQVFQRLRRRELVH